MAVAEKGFDMDKMIDGFEEMSQNEIVLEHMKEYETISFWEGAHKYSIGNTQGRIADLRQRGHGIVTHQSGGNGFATYRLVYVHDEAEEDDEKDQ